MIDEIKKIVDLKDGEDLLEVLQSYMDLFKTKDEHIVRPSDVVYSDRIFLSTDHETLDWVFDPNPEWVSINLEVSDIGIPYNYEDFAFIKDLYYIKDNALEAAKDLVELYNSIDEEDFND